MSTPSPFHVAQQASNNFSNSFKKVQDENVIEDILSNAMKSGSPEVLQNSIGKILSQVSPERQANAVQFLQNTLQIIEKKAAAKKLEDTERDASKTGGYTYGAPSGVQSQQVKDNNKQNRLNKYPGLGTQQSPGQGAPALSPSQQFPGVGALQNPQGGTQSGTLPPSIFRQMTKDQLITATGAPDREVSEPAKAQLKILEHEEKLANDNLKGKRDVGNRLGEKVLERADEVAESLPQKQTALNLMNQAIVDKDLSWWSQDNLAEATGIEGLRSKEGAIFKTAAKEYFLGNIARAGARPNQWIEQQISDMLTKIGRSTAANLSVSRALQNELDIEQERIRLTSEVKNELDVDGKDYGNLGSEVKKRLSKFAEQQQNLLFNDLRAIKSIDDKTPEKFHKVQPGTAISAVMVDALLSRFNNDAGKAKAEAKKLGYAINE